MKTIQLLVIIAAFANCFSQTGANQCPCPTIGIDALWAETNKVTCYLIPVDRDSKNPASGKFSLAVLKAPAKNLASQAEPLLYLHGGPGIATIENVPKYLASGVWNTIRKDRPIIFFDYRGTGFSQPQLCPDIDKEMAQLAGPELSAEAMQELKLQLIKKCRLQHSAEGIDMGTFSSVQSAADAEAIRKNLNIEKWSVYGVSHGTTVALGMLRDYGKNISSMIVDSPFPPNAPWPDFVRPFAQSFGVLEKNVANDGSVSANFGSIRKDFVNAIKRLNTTPYKLEGPGGSTYSFTGNDFAWSVWTAMLKPKYLPLVPLVIQETAGSDQNLPVWLESLGNRDSFGKFSEYQSKAILCFEGKPKNDSDSKSSLQANYPDFEPFNIDFESDLCAALQPAGAGPDNFSPVVSDVPVLILSGEYDPVCPPFFGELTAKTLSQSTFINVPAASHAAIHADDCLLHIATSFLANPKAKVPTQCVSNRPKVKFVSKDLAPELGKLKKS